MRTVYASDIEEELAFVRAAAKEFADNPKLATFTTGDIEPEALLALRWGLGNDCVLVVKLDTLHRPTVYGQAITTAERTTP